MSDFSARSRAALELLFFIGGVAALKAVLDEFIWKYAGPVALLSGIAALAVYFKARGERWSSVGIVPLKTKRDWFTLIPKIFLTVLAFMAAVALAIYGGEALGWEFMKDEPEGVDKRWGDIEGNLLLLTLWIGLAWVSAAFGEEVMFRGLMITRLTTLFGSGKGAVIIAILLAAVFFGFLHYYYQGMRGFVTTGLIGLAFGIMFLVLRKNLWPIIIVHGCVDTIGFVARYLGQV